VAAAELAQDAPGPELGVGALAGPRAFTRARLAAFGEGRLAPGLVRGDYMFARTVAGIADVGDQTGGAGQPWAAALVCWLLPAGWPGPEAGRDRAGFGARQSATPSMTAVSRLSGTAAACRVVR
jgi:hypothetical protein